MDELKDKWVIFDIDGVLCKKGTLLPVDAGVGIYKALAQTNPILFLTFRPEDTREETLAWLNQWVDKDIGNDQLFMRIPDTDEGEYPAPEQKVDILMGLFEEPEDILVVFDDEAANIAAFRAQGITAYQTLRS
jgi:phosphoglycolate phosphatase-like HAD superfamily hydrolase